MSLLLKSLRQIDSRTTPAEVAIPVEAPAVVTPVATDTVPLPTPRAIIPASPPDEPDEPIESDELTDSDVIAQQSIADVMDPIEPTFPSIDPLPIEAQHRLTTAPDVAVEPPLLLMTSTVSETATDESPAAVSSEVAVEATLEQISGLNQLLTAEIDNSRFVELVEPAPLPLLPPTELPQIREFKTPASIAIPSPLQASAPLKLNAEFRELRDHFLSRFSLARNSMVLLISAGRIATDVSWAVPFAASLLEHLQGGAASIPKALLIELAGPQCGLSKTLGLESGVGISEVLAGKTDWRSAIQQTVDPQIQFLATGATAAVERRKQDLATACADLKKQFDLCIVAAGPAMAANSKRELVPAIASLLLQVDAAILCVELDGTPKHVADESLRLLTQHRVNLLGCVIRGDAMAA